MDNQRDRVLREQIRLHDRIRRDGSEIRDEAPECRAHHPWIGIFDLLREAGIDVQDVPKLLEGRPNVVDRIKSGANPLTCLLGADQGTHVRNSIEHMCESRSR